MTVSGLLVVSAFVVDSCWCGVVVEFLISSFSTADPDASSSVGFSATSASLVSTFITKVNSNNKAN